jgi:hypothetical protein
MIMRCWLLRWVSNMKHQVWCFLNVMVWNFCHCMIHIWHSKNLFCHCMMHAWHVYVPQYGMKLATCCMMKMNIWNLFHCHMINAQYRNVPKIWIGLEVQCTIKILSHLNSSCYWLKNLRHIIVPQNNPPERGKAYKFRNKMPLNQCFYHFHSCSIFLIISECKNLECGVFSHLFIGISNVFKVLQNLKGYSDLFRSSKKVHMKL